ncbi:MAG: hypothetical protein AB1Z23_13135 [Eubacteriales bacterium]
MIKKTFETLKKNPIILLWFAIPFVYTTVNTLLNRQGMLVGLSEMMNVPAEEWYTILPKILISMGIALVYQALWTFLLYPAISRYIYWTVDEKPRENWFARSLKGYWWRYFVLLLIYMAAAMAISVPFIIIMVIVVIATNTAGGMFIGYGAMIFIIMLVGIFFYIGTAAAYAEDKFNTAVGNLFRAGAKYFFRAVPIFLLMLIPTMVTLIAMAIYEVQTIPDIFIILSSAWGSIFLAFISVYFMHCYMDYKKSKEKMDITQAQEMDSMLTN